MASTPNYRQVLRTGSALILILGCSTATWAQGTAASQARSGADSVTADAVDAADIIVTARKREESVQEVPLSIVVLNSKGLQDRGINSVEDIGLFAPGFTFRRDEKGRASNRPVIRGQSNVAGEPSASFFVDGIYVDGPLGSYDLGNVERVEVIRGPQAALYGRATYSGAVNIITRRPTNDLAGQVAAEVAEDGQYLFDASVSGPIVADKLFFSAGGNYSRYGGEYVNTVDRRRVGQERTWSAGGKLLFTPGDGIEILAQARYQKDDDGLPATGLQGASFNNCRLNDYLLPNGTINPRPSNPNSRGYYCGDVQPENVVIAFNTADYDRYGVRLGRQNRFLRSALQIKADLGFAELALTSGLNRTTLTRGIDTDYTPVQGFGGAFNTYNKDKTKDFSQEVRLTSDQASRLRWIAGLYYFRSDRIPKINAAVLPTGISYTPAPTVNIRNKAVFGAFDWDIAPRLTFSAEGRYQEEKIDIKVSRLSTTLKSFLPRLTIAYHPGDNQTLYALVAKGNKPGGFNTGLVNGDIVASQQALARSLLVYKEETAWTIEVGAKSSWLDNRLTANLALYRIDITGQQLTNSVLFDLASRSTPLAVAYIQSIDNSNVTGLEFDAAFRVNPHLDISGSISVLDAKIGKFNSFDQFVLDSTVPGAVFNPAVDGNSAGHPLPRTSPVQFNLAAAYHTAVTENLDMFLRVDYSFQGSEHDSTEGLASTGDSSIVNVRAGVENGRFKLEGFVDNLLNDHTPASLFRYIDVSAANIPRTVATGSTSQRAFIATLRRSRQVGARVSVKF